MQPWLDRLLGVVQVLAILAAIAIGLWWLTAWAEEHHRDVADQIGRVEASVNEVRDFVRKAEAESAAKSEANRRRIEAVEGMVPEAGWDGDGDGAAGGPIGPNR